MSHSVFFSVKVSFVVFVRCYLNWHIFHYFESISLESNTFDGIIGKKFNLSHPQFSKYLRPYPIVSKVGVESEVYVSVHCVVSLFL